MASIHPSPLPKIHSSLPIQIQPQPQTQIHNCTTSPVVAAPFLQPTLTRLPSISDLSVRTSADLHPPDAAAALAGVRTSNINMEGSGHRRRRSSLLNNLETSIPSAKSKTKTTFSPIQPGKDNIQEEWKLGDSAHSVGDRHSEDDRSTSVDMELEDLEEEEGLQDDEEAGLTGRDKSRRRDKRRRNTLLDQRVAPEVPITAEEKKEADRSVVKKSLINGLLIGLWYLFSLSISIVSFLSCPQLVCYLANFAITVQQMDV